jgi:uncharacterized protein (UPF0305 family)
MDTQQQIDELKAEIDSLKRSSTFPKDIGDAIAERLSDKEQVIARESTKAQNIYKIIAISGDPQNINVCAFPDGFRVFRVGGKDYYIPYYNLV